MTESLFSHLERKGFLRGTSPMAAAIERASSTDILDLARVSCELTSAEHMEPDNSALAHCASLSLSCARWPCYSLKCRSSRAEQLGHFAALYSDRVYVRNFLSDYPQGSHHSTLPRESEMRQMLADDLELLGYLRPFIEANRIQLVTPPNYCLDCIANQSLGHDGDKLLRRARRSLERRMEDEVDACVSYLNAKLFKLEARGPEYLLDHGFAGFTSRQAIGNLSEMPRIYARVLRGERVHLSSWAWHKIGHAKRLASDEFASIVFALSLAESLQAAFLTERPLHVDILKELSTTSHSVARDMLIEKHFTCLVPFLKELTPIEILKLRRNEEDAFVLFRAALAQAVDEYRTAYGQFREADAKAVYQDILRPKLAELDERMSKARRLLIKGSVRKVLGWTAAISFGVYTGLLPIEAATTLGLVGILAKLIEDMMTSSDTEESARGHNMYFLWKIKETASKSAEP